MKAVGPPTSKPRATADRCACAAFADDGCLQNLTVANGVAAVFFVFFADVRWLPALLIAVGSIAGAQFAARYGRKIPPQVLRWIVVIGGTIVAMILIFK